MVQKTMALVEAEAVAARHRWVGVALPWCWAVGEVERCCELEVEAEGRRLVRWHGHGWVVQLPLVAAVVVRLRRRCLDWAEAVALDHGSEVVGELRISSLRQRVVEL